MFPFALIRVLWVLLYPVSHPNHTFYFYRFVEYVFCDNMGLIVFDPRGCGGCQRPKTSYLGAHFGTLTQFLAHPSAPVLLTKDSPRNFISYDSQPLFSLLISNSRTKPAGLDFQCMHNLFLFFTLQGLSLFLKKQSP